MSEEALTDDQSHYEVSLTAGQAFLAFVLLLLSLAASFAFGLLIGKGQGTESLIARKEPVVREVPAGPKKEVAVANDEFKAVPEAVITEETETAAAPLPNVGPASAGPSETLKQRPAEADPTSAPAAHPVYAQLFSTSDQKNAEKMAASLIDGGFSTAYVERGTTDKGAVYRVRVRFPSEAAARAAEPKLRAFSKDVWITKQAT